MLKKARPCMFSKAGAGGFYAGPSRSHGFKKRIHMLSEWSESIPVFYENGCRFHLPVKVHFSLQTTRIMTMVDRWESIIFPTRPYSVYLVFYS
jgi:hypothetical protein